MESSRLLSGVVLLIAAIFIALLAAALGIIDVWERTKNGDNSARLVRRHWLAAAMVVALATLCRDWYWPQLAFLIALLGYVLWFNWRFLWGLVLYLQDNLAQTFLLAVFYLMIWGWLFSWFGIPDLIWHEHCTTRLASAVASTLVLAVFGVCAFYVGSAGPIDVQKIGTYYETDRAHRVLADWLAPRDAKGTIDPLHQFLWVVQLPFVLLLLLPPLLPRIFPYVPRLEEGSELLLYLANLFVWSCGVVCGVVFVKVALYVGKRISATSDSFADAFGDAVRHALGAAEAVADWLRALFSAVWNKLVAFWESLADPKHCQTWVHDQFEIARQNVRSWPVQLWTRLKGGASANNVAPPQRPLVANPVEDHKVQTRGLFSFVLLVSAFFAGLNLADAFSLWDVPPGVALFALLALLVMLNALVRLLLPPDLWYWRLPGVVLMALWIAWANEKSDELQFENLSYDSTARADLQERIRTAYFAAPGGTKTNGDSLVDDAAAREALALSAPVHPGRQEAEACGRELFRWRCQVAGLDVSGT